MTTGCPCDDAPFPAEPDIPPGLATLPRQVLGFPDYRHAILAQLRSHPALAGWRAREGDDLGLMLVESWAYVLDVVAFYDQQIAQQLYLGTATDPGATRRLVELIGYRPRPAVAAEGLLAAIAERGPKVIIPAGTAFRSEAFGNEPPQVFESDAEVAIEWRRNRWTLAGVVPTETAAGMPWLLDPRTLRLQRGAWVVVDGPGLPAAATIVTDLRAT